MKTGLGMPRWLNDKNLLFIQGVIFLPLQKSGKGRGNWTHQLTMLTLYGVVSIVTFVAAVEHQQSEFQTVNEHRLRFSSDWYNFDFIAGFAALLQHDAHISIPNYKSSNRLMMVFTPYPNKAVNEILPYGSTTHFVSVVYNRQHFAVLCYDIYECTVTVFDGLNQKTSKWQDHIIHTVKTYGLKPSFSSATCKFREHVYIDVDECATKRRPSERRDMTLEIRFDDLKEEPWLVKNEHSYVQGDGVSCGPIACLKLLEIYGFIQVGSIETIGESACGYRNVVMDYYNDCVSRFDSVLKVEVRTKTILHGKQPQRGEETLEAQAVDAHEAALLSVPSPTARVSRVTAVEGAGLNFAPKCDNFCFTSRTVCDRIKNNVPINNLGDYVVFVSI